MHERLGKEMACRIVKEPIDPRYYLLYEAGGRSFHKPIKEKLVRKWTSAGLEVVDIGELDTKGLDEDELLPMDFVDRVVSLVEGGDYRYVSD